MLTIKCAKCRAKIFKYLKLGKGRVLRCYKIRIKKDYTIHDEDTILCKCGNTIGTNEGGFIKMKQGAFIYSGTKE